MTVVVPNVPTPVPSRADPLNFAARADAYHTALPITVDALNLQNAENNSLNAAVNATAAAVAMTANVTAWSAATAYAVGNCVFDTTNFLTYRRKVAGTTATRPGLDTTNWALLTGFGDVTTTGTQTLTNKTFGDNPTFSAGTANGVLYLNGSKVATSGSALVFTSSNLGIGTSSPGARLEVHDTANAVQMRLGAPTGSAGISPTLRFQARSVDDTVSYYASIKLNSAGPLLTLMAPAGSAPTLDVLNINSSGRVGIGTSVPLSKFQVAGSFARGEPVTKTTNFTIADTENWIICNGTGTITVTLTAASDCAGREFTIKTIAGFTVVSASSNVVPLAGGAAGTAILPATAGAWATLVSNGANWIIMQS